MKLFNRVFWKKAVKRKYLEGCQEYYERDMNNRNGIKDDKPNYHHSPILETIKYMRILKGWGLKVCKDWIEANIEKFRKWR